jgi:hypothetical protein
MSRVVGALRGPWLPLGGAEKTYITIAPSTHLGITIHWSHFNISWNNNWVKWWWWKCLRFNSCQSWIWFKCDWWKWFTTWKTWWTKNFKTSWKNNWLKWWWWKCLRFNSFQSRICFKCDWWKWLTLLKTWWTKNFNIMRNCKSLGCWKMTNQFMMDKLNQKMIIDGESWRAPFQRNRIKIHINECRSINKLNTSWNYSLLFALPLQVFLASLTRQCPKSPLSSPTPQYRSFVTSPL